MKNILRHTFPFLALLAFWGCAKDGESVPKGNSGEGGLIELGFNVSVPEMSEAGTRAFGPTTSGIDSMYVIVFDQYHYFKEYALAAPISMSFGSDGSQTQSFKVRLHETNDVSYLHFLANCSKSQFDDFVFGTEYSVIGSIVTDPSKTNPATGGYYPEDAYWQRRVLGGGIHASSLSDLGTVDLVRNFLEIKVSCVAQNQTLLGFVVMNYPKAGTIAPYNTRTKGFADYSVRDLTDGGGNVIKSDTSTPTGWLPYDALYNQKFYGYFSPSASLGNSDASQLTDEDFRTAPFYMYEHSGGDFAGQTPSYLLLKIRDAVSGIKYYKVDLTYLDPETHQPVYYNLLRNFSYHVIIKDIANSATAGYSTIGGADAHAADNNLSSSVTIANIRRLSNGKELIEVGYTEKVITSSNPVTVRFRYSPNNNATYDNSKIYMYLRTDLDDVFSGASNDSYIKSTDDADGWRTIVLKPAAEPAATEKIQYLVVYSYDPDNGKSISRNIKYHYVRPYDMSFVLDIDRYNRTFDMLITIPDELNQSLFPMRFRIESENNLIYPNTSKPNETDVSGSKQYEYMSVETGLSLNPAKSGERNYAFVKTITYDDYLSDKMDRSQDGFVTFRCHFKYSQPTTTVNDNIYIATECFNNGTVTLESVY